MKPILLAGLILSLLGTSCSKKLRQISSSMEPTIKRGEVFTLDLASRSPKRWDVVVFETPMKAGEVWTMRVVGMPGEVVEFKPPGMLIDGHPMSAPAHLGLPPYTAPRSIPAGFSAGTAKTAVSFPYKIPPNHFFVMGDNVATSFDSRYWGGVDGHKIAGKVRGK